MAPGADGSDASLTNKNLLLSPSAEIDTKPELEIYADEVKAAHGATVGQLDERSLFYLRSRGIPLGEARALLPPRSAARCWMTWPMCHCASIWLNDGDAFAGIGFLLPARWQAGSAGIRQRVTWRRSRSGLQKQDSS